MGQSTQESPLDVRTRQHEREAAQCRAREIFEKWKLEQKPRLGVAALVTNPEEHLLLGRRGKEPNYGRWIIPGGGLKFGESIVDGARREILEETGLGCRQLGRDIERLKRRLAELEKDTEGRLRTARLNAARGVYEAMATDDHLGVTVTRYAAVVARTLAGDAFEWARDKKQDLDE